jgi:hypothetical protein
MQRTRSSASGKKVPQLGEQEKQSLPPLNVYSDKDVAEEYEDIARHFGVTVAQLMGMEDFPKADVAWKFALGEPLVRPEQVAHLPTQMRRLHDWYMEYSKEGRIMLMVVVKKEHYFRDNQICIMLEEFFFSYTIKTPSTNLSSVAIVCK